jgi:uroporphyrinogen-III decarboxylase
MLAEVTSPLKGEWMTPRRRFLSAVYRGHVDKVPACTLSSVVTVEMMDLVNAPFPEAHLDAELMARLAATAHDVFGMDTIMPVFHSQLESDALGGETEWAEKDNWPSPSRFTIEEPDQVTIPDDFVKRPRSPAPSSCSASGTRMSPSSARSTARGRSGTRWSASRAS